MKIIFPRSLFISLTLAILVLHPTSWAQSIKTIDGLAEIPIDIYKSKQSKAPTIVYAHGCSGYDNFDIKKARLIRSWGYNVVVAEYTRGRSLSDKIGYNGRNITCVQGYTIYPQHQRADDLIAVGNWVINQEWHTGKIAVIGFSLGGGAVEYLINDTRTINPYSAGVSFYPFCRIDPMPRQTTLPNQFHIGTLDESYDRCLYFNSRFQRHNYFIYDNATHAFDNDWVKENKHGYKYDRNSTEKAFDHVKRFFEEILK